METLTVGPLQSGKFPNPPYLVEKIETGEQEDSDGNSEENTEQTEQEKTDNEEKGQNDRE